jgi:hypothetical protein
MVFWGLVATDPGLKSETWGTFRLIRTQLLHSNLEQPGASWLATQVLGCLQGLGNSAVVSHISRKTSEIWGTADSAYKCNISRIGDSCNMPRSFRHLDLSERVFLETQLSHGRRPARIAAELKRARSTITREIRRNGWRAKLRKGSIAGG